VRQLVYDWDMQLIMNDEELTTIEQVKQFLEGSETLTFRGVSIEERYRWIETVLVRFRYLQLNRVEKGIIRRYIEKVSGYSRSQVCRLIRQCKQKGRLKKASCNRHRFPRKYTLADIALLAMADELHDYLSGPATKKIMEREWAVYGLLTSGISLKYLSPTSTICAEVSSIVIQTNDMPKPNHPW